MIEKPNTKGNMRKCNDHTGCIGITTRHIIHFYSCTNKWNVIEGVDYQADVRVRKRNERDWCVYKMQIDPNYRFKVCVRKGT